jgi:hypothetical protein
MVVSKNAVSQALSSPWLSQDFTRQKYAFEEARGFPS